MYGVGQLARELNRLLRCGPGRHLRWISCPAARPTTARDANRRDLRVAVELARVVLWPRSAHRRMAYRYRAYAARVMGRAGLAGRTDLGRVAAGQVRVAAYDLRTLRRGALGGIGVAGSLVALSVWWHAPASAAPAAPLPHPWAAYLTATLVLACVARGSIATFGRDARSGLWRLAAAAALAWFSLLAAVAGRLPSLLVVVIAAAAVALVPLAVLLLALHAGLSTLEAWRDRSLTAAEPDATATDAILRLLHRSRSAPGWQRSAMRAAMLADLERLARAVDGGFAGLMRSGDRSTDAWVRDRAAGAGAAVRRLKRWVITPLADTRERLRERLAADLVALAQGRWDDLERATGEPDPLARTPWRTTVRSLVRVTVVALGPGLALWACRRLDPSAAAALPAWAPAACLLWAVVTVLLAVDPSLPDRTRAVRGVLDTIAGRGKA